MTEVLIRKLPRYLATIIQLTRYERIETDADGDWRIEYVHRPDELFPIHGSHQVIGNRRRHFRVIRTRMMVLEVKAQSRHEAFITQAGFFHDPSDDVVEIEQVIVRRDTIENDSHNTLLSYVDN